MEPFHPKLRVGAAAIEPLVSTPPAFDMLVFDPEGCITQGAALRSTVAQICAAIESGDHLRSPVTNRGACPLLKRLAFRQIHSRESQICVASRALKNKNHHETVRPPRSREVGINVGATRSSWGSHRMGNGVMSELHSPAKECREHTQSALKSIVNY
jgi:hypothetical protein